MNQPQMDLTRPEEQVDTDGTKWVQALVDPKGRVIAGYQESGAFKCYVDTEKLFTTAMAAMVQLQEALT